MDKRQVEILRSSQLFSEIDIKYIDMLSCHPNVKLTSFSRGDTIFPEESGYGLCVLLSGGAECYNGQTLLNRYKEGDSFGAASLFCNEDYPTRITAKSSGYAFYIGKEAAEFLISECPTFAVKYIKLLSQKIHLLNRKIDSFTADNSLKKVAKYIESNANRDGELILNISLSRLAAALDIGRASLYRALDTLEGGGAIKRNGRAISLTNADKLSTFLKEGN